jgi:soluble lytic murein transglycosylase
LVRVKYATDNDFDRKLVLMGLKRLLRKRAKAFPTGWARYGERVSKPSGDFDQFTHFVARWYAWHYDEQAWEWLERADPKHQDEELMARRIRMALQARDWAGVLSWIERLPAAQAAEPTWQYWGARAQLAILPELARDPSIQASTRQAARAQLTSLARERHFYGFLASEFLGQAPALNHRPFVLSEAARRAMWSQKGFAAAYEWFRLERFVSAQREWNRLLPRLSGEQKSVAAKFAHEWGWHDQAIRTAAQAHHRDDLLVRFPMGHFDVVTEKALQQGITADWAFAVIRQESAYQANARSPVGALGLMQLMPGTAKTLLRKQGRRYPGKKGVLKVEKNIALGTGYLAQLYDRFKGSVPLATAGYNAGPRRSVSWQDPVAAIPGDLWIETVPIAETRDYVKNILTYQVIYRWQLGLDPKLHRSVASVPSLAETDAQYSMQ